MLYRLGRLTDRAENAVAQALLRNQSMASPRVVLTRIRNIKQTH